MEAEAAVRLGSTQAVLSRWLPAVALAVLLVDVGLIVASAGSTLGYDFQAYVGAAHRILEGRPLYDPNVDVAGGFAIYLYPPPFALLLVPFAFLPGSVALWIWTGLLVVAFVVGSLLLPVRQEVRWLTVLLGGLMWPLLYSVKLGQVGPLLFLLFAAGWRWLDAPGRLGITIAAGTIVKLQPALLIGWAAASRRWRAAGLAMGLVAAAALSSTALVGADTWREYVALLARVSSPVTTPHNFTPGAVAYQLGVPEGAATYLQWASVLATIAVMARAWWRANAEASYLVTVVASQLVSPLLWDHYAMILLLPVAYLLERRQWWAALVPLALALPVVGITPAVAYPACFAAMLVAPLLVGRDSRAQAVTLT